MHGPALHAVFVWIIALIGILLMLLRPWHIREAAWISAAAILLVVSRLVPLHPALAALGKGTDVYLFLTGMMLLAELARHEGVFDWVAGHAVCRSRNSAARLFLLIYLTGVVVTAFLSNDATAVVLTPAVLAAVRRARVDPKPYLLACALVANSASFLLPIANPANLVVYGRQLPHLGSWLRIFLLPSAVALAVTYFCLFALSRKSLTAQVGCPEEQSVLTPSGRLAFAGLIFAAVVLLTASGLGIGLGIPTCAAALAALVLVSFRDRGIYKAAVREVSWSILPLVAGLFVLVESLNRTGMLHVLESSLRRLTHQPSLAANLAASGAAAVLSNAMNNLPVALAAGSALPLTPQLAHAVLIGVNLGPNLSVAGSLATILWLMALRKEGIPLTRKQFFKTGLIVMPAALILSVLALWLIA
ncbi:MAG TPA: SLC13 family permease [Acidobacteriaceae bacterium]|nr:SLC13 family permease [Acidobacteriaceae bacterium]